MATLSYPTRTKTELDKKEVLPPPPTDADTHTVDKRDVIIPFMDSDSTDDDENVALTSDDNSENEDHATNPDTTTSRKDPGDTAALLSTLSITAALPALTPSILSTTIRASPLSPTSGLLLRRVAEEQHHATTRTNAAKNVRDLVSRAVGSQRMGPQGVRVYGSSLSELATRGSDVDLSLDLPPFSSARLKLRRGEINYSAFEKVKKKAAYMVADALRQACGRDRDLIFSDVKPLAFARIPLVKTACHLGPNFVAHADICFGNDLAVLNSNLLREYALVAEGCKQLMMLVKIWSKAKKVSDASRGTLSSYCWMNMAVFYLQWLGRAPNLQEGAASEECDGFEVGFNRARDIAFVPDQATAGWTLPMLAWGFFAFYDGFDIVNGMISIKIGGRGDEGKLRKGGFEKTKKWRLCVEDPFENLESDAPHDLGMVVGEVGQDAVFGAIEEARKICEEGRWEEIFADGAFSGNGRNKLPRAREKEGRGSKKMRKTKERRDRSRERERKERSKAEKKDRLMNFSPTPEREKAALAIRRLELGMKDLAKELNGVYTKPKVTPPTPQTAAKTKAKASEGGEKTKKSRNANRSARRKLAKKKACEAIETQKALESKPAAIVTKDWE